MSTEAIPRNAKAVLRAQTRFALAILAAVCATSGAVGLLSRDTRLDDRLVAAEVEQFRNGERFLFDSGLFREFEDRLILRDIPGADYSRGGVYFFGTSPMKWALQRWALTPAERRVVGDYGIGLTRHSDHLHLIRYLAERRGFLDAGPKTHVVLGAFWTLGQSSTPSEFFDALLGRYGLYDFDERTGITRAAGPDWLHSLREARARCSSAVGGLGSRAWRHVSSCLGLSEDGLLSDPEKARAQAQALADRPDWERHLETQMRALEEQIDYVRGRGAKVTVVLLPTRRASLALPQGALYVRKVRDLCRRRSVRCVDLTRALKEEEFWDLNHSTYVGREKTHRALMGIAYGHLRRAGLLPSAGGR